MTRKQRRGIMIGGGVLVLAVAGLLVMTALRDTVVFFHTPSDVKAKDLRANTNARIRLGGLVDQNSVVRGKGSRVEFTIKDTVDKVRVSYDGILPDLFREGQGVVVEGRFGQDGEFRAVTVLAKHDETYMPPEVAKALKQQGYWQHGEKAGAKPAEGSDGRAQPAAASKGATP
jgi:cytochrome c-type biogenesis protein CcmE